MKKLLLALLLFVGVSAYSQSKWINVADSITMDSTVNIGAELNDLLANVQAGSTLYFPTASYLINTSWVINKQIQIYSNYATFKTTANITMVDLTAQNININNIIFKGDGQSSGKTSQFLLRLLNGRNAIRGCNFYDASAEATRVQATAAPSHGALFEGNIYYYNNVGMNMLANFTGEYVTVNGGIMGRNKTAVKLGAGNFIIDGVHADYNDTAFSMVPSANDGHGIISNSSMNHCIRSFSSSGTLLGMNIVGCMIYSGDIYIKNSKGITFKDCFFRSVVFNVDNSSGSVDNSIADTYATLPFTAPFTVAWTNPSTSSFRFRNINELTGPTPDLITRTVNDTLTEIDGDILANGAISITLPPAYKKFDSPFTITNISSTEIVTIIGTISGLVNPTLNSQYSYMTIYSDGVNYYVQGVQNGRVSGITPRQVTVNEP